VANCVSLYLPTKHTNLEISHRYLHYRVSAIASPQKEESEKKNELTSSGGAAPKKKKARRPRRLSNIEVFGASPDRKPSEPEILKPVSTSPQMITIEPLPLVVVEQSKQAPTRPITPPIRPVTPPESSSVPERPITPPIIATTPNEPTTPRNQQPTLSQSTEK